MPGPDALLDRVRVVLVQPTHPGNIGAAARAMKTMGLRHLALVTPRHFPHPDASARAAGADDILASARVHDSLADALAGSALVFGTSARRRGLSAPVLDPRGCAATLRTAGPVPVALLFGREQSGLTNDELDRCHYAVEIPAAPGFSSLNLAAAVQVLAYELRLAALSDAAGTAAAAARTHAPETPAPPAIAGSEFTHPDASLEFATADDMERLYAHWQHVLIGIEFLNPTHPRALMRRLRRLFNRVQLDRHELNILRGILTQVEIKAGLRRD